MDIEPRWVTYTSVLLALLFIELIARAGVFSAITLIPLTEIAVILFQNLADGTLIPHLTQTGTAIFAGYVLALLSGFPIAIALWKYETLGEIADPFLLSLYAVPLYIFYPLLIIAFGLNIIPVIIIAWIMSSIAIIENVRSGLSDVPDVYSKVGRVMQLTRYQAFRQIYLPAAAPQIFTGLKLGFIYSLIGTIASEFILADRGLGFLVSYSYNQFNTGRMYASIALVIVIAVAANKILLLIQRRLEEWRNV